MTSFLRQSTAETITMGVFVDDTDGKTAETALTIAQADIRLSKNGGAFAQTNNVAGATHMEFGNYSVPLNTTDTNTLGRLRVSVLETGALPVWRDFMVVSAQVWDSLFGADQLQVHVNEMTAGIITAAVIATNAIDDDALAADAVTALQSGLASQVSVDDLPTNAELATSQAAADDATLAAIAALNNLSAAQVNAEVDTALLDVGVTLTVTGRIDAAISTRSSQVSVDDLPTNAELATSQGTADDATLAAIAALNNLSAAQVDTALATYDAPTFAELDVRTDAIEATLAIIAAFLDTEVSAILADTNELQVDWVNGGRLDLLVDAIKAITDALTAAAATKLALSASTIVTGAAIAGTLSTTAMTTNLTEATNDHYNGRIIIWTSGVLKDQATDITDYNGATKMLTYTAITEAPTAADTFVIV